VRNSGGLGIVPPGDELNLDAYRTPAAQVLMPGTIEAKFDRTPPEGSAWNWEPPAAKYQHSFMQRFKAWKERPKTDFFVLPRGAFAYWDIKKRPDSTVLVEYVDYDKDHKPRPKASGKPAVLESLFDAKSGIQGKVLLLTTPLDEQTPPWNNYAEDVTSFYLALVMQATGYLAGESAAPRLNFELGRGDPVVVLRGVPALTSATLRGPSYFKALAIEPGDSTLTPREVATPGQFILEGKTKAGGEMRRLAAFSVNVPAEECNLSQVPAAEIEPLFAGDGLLTLGRLGSLHDALKSYRNEPLDLTPYFMVALLFALALENLLANKFYRQVGSEG
jgi:hypothetical protein